MHSSHGMNMPRLLMGWHVQVSLPIFLLPCVRASSQSCDPSRLPITTLCPADTLRLLLVLGSQCNLPDKEGCTPLHWAAIRGHTEACTVLLQVGGRVRTGQGERP